MIILIYTCCVSYLEYMKSQRSAQGKEADLLITFFQSPSRESSFPISYFVGLAEYLTNVMPIVIGDFYTMINLYSVRPTVVKSVDVVTIRQRRNSDTDSNDNFHPHGVIFDEWEELEAISSSNLITQFFNINIKKFHVFKFHVFFKKNIIK